MLAPLDRGDYYACMDQHIELHGSRPSDPLYWPDGIVKREARIIVRDLDELLTQEDRRNHCRELLQNPQDILRETGAAIVEFCRLDNIARHLRR